MKEEDGMEIKDVVITEEDCHWEGDKLFIRIKSEDGQEVELDFFEEVLDRILEDERMH